MANKGTEREGGTMACRKRVESLMRALESVELRARKLADCYAGNRRTEDEWMDMDSIRMHVTEAKEEIQQFVEARLG